tara:strand:- start:1012 stop:1263 length:252 start_codon:yes stop_codon:yes gene_type:complete
MQENITVFRTLVKDLTNLDITKRKIAEMSGMSYNRFYSLYTNKKNGYAKKVSNDELLDFIGRVDDFRDKMFEVVYKAETSFTE